MTNADRKEKVNDLLDYYESTPDQILERRLAQRFKDPKPLRLVKHWRNVVKEVTNGTALVYERPPEVRFSSSENGLGLRQADAWNRFHDEVNLPAVMQAIDAYSRLGGSLLVRVDEVGKNAAGQNQVDLTLITANMLDVETDQRRPTRALRYWVQRLEDQERGKNAWLPSSLVPAQIVYDVYDVSGPVVTWTVVDSQGTPKSKPVNLAYNPFVEFHSALPIKEWWAPAPFDLLSAQQTIDDRLVDLGHQFRLNAFAIPILSGSISFPRGADGGREVRLDPAYPLISSSDDDARGRKALEYASPENDFTLQTLMKAIEDEARAIRRSRGIVDEQNTATSGFALSVMNLPLMRGLRRDRAVHTPAFRRLVAVGLRALGFDRLADFDVELPESTLPEDPASSLQESQRIQQEITANLTSVVRELQRRNPDLDEAGALELATKIAEENRLATGGGALDHMAQQRQALLDGVRQAADPNPTA